MILRRKAPTSPIPFHARRAPDAKAEPVLDYFLAFQESFNRFPGFNYEVQGVFQERVNGHIKFHTYVVRE